MIDSGMDAALEAVLASLEEEMKTLPRFIPMEQEAGSLIIVATPQQYEEIRDLLAHIDSRPMQVLLKMVLT